MVSDDDDDNSAASEGEEDQEPSKPAGKPQSKQHTDSESPLSDVPDKSPVIELGTEKEEIANNDSSSELSDVITVELPKRKQPSKPKPKPKPKAKPTKTKPAAPAPASDDDDDSSDLSSVLDDAPPPPKRKPSTNKSKPTTTSAADTPDETLIKTLQSHLAKCGLRKVWAFEFKKHGADTPKARIAHLRALLADVGMPGRFSEARAREIKEMRELQADLQDVVQGEKSWGVGGGGRGTRRAAAAAAAGKRKVARKEEEEEEEASEDGGGDNGSKGKGKKVVEESEGSEEGGEGGKESEGSEEEEEDEEGGKLAVRGKGPAKRRADLAFLDDESESE